MKIMLLIFPRPSAFQIDINVWGSFSWLKFQHSILQKAIPADLSVQDFLFDRGSQD